MSRVVWSTSSWDALEIMRGQENVTAAVATPMPFDCPDTVIPEEVVMQAVAASNRIVAARLEAEDTKPARRDLRPLGLFLVCSAGIALVALVHLVPMLIEGLEALWRMVGM